MFTKKKQNSPLRDEVWERIKDLPFRIDGPVREGERLTLRAENEEVTFDLLAQLSDLFKTRLINLHAETRESGGCDTCAFSYTATHVYIDRRVAGYLFVGYRDLIAEVIDEEGEVVASYDRGWSYHAREIS